MTHFLEINMKNISAKALSQSSIDGKILYLLAISVFLPFYITALALIAVFCYALFSHKLKGEFTKNGRKIINVFTVYSIIVAFCYKNYVGMICSVAFFMLIYISAYSRKYYTAESFEKVLDICAICGPITSVLCLIEYLQLLFSADAGQELRCELFYFNSNYLATVLGTVIIICAYKIVIKKRRIPIYFISAFITAFGAYLTGSMFVWIEVFVGCAVLLMISRKQQLLSILLLLAGTATIVLYFIPDILPRIEHATGTTNNRIRIWTVCFDAIKHTPIFGRGFLTYFHIYTDYPNSYVSTHAHNIPMELIMSFGIVGAIIISMFFVLYYKRIFICRNAQSKYHYSSIAIALTAAIAAHGLIDLTFMWVQTGLLYCILMGGFGIEERLLKINKS